MKEIIAKHPILQDIADLKPVVWINESKGRFNEEIKQVDLGLADIEDAEARLARFAPYLREVFPDTEKTDGLIESPLIAIDQMKDYIEDYYQSEISGKLYLKIDDLLPIAGTIKARGAIYEVLKHAEMLALEEGLLRSIEDDYVVFASPSFTNFFAKHRIVVGTTGNLGISVGIMGSQLGFKVTVHMSTEAKSWKKDLLRLRGVKVVEHETNFTEAVNKGRQEAEQDDNSYFVDDEHSIDLFLGYTVAGIRLKKQLADLEIKVDADHPLFLYLPCGIGGSPGGVAFGIKNIFGDHVHCFYAEPTKVPSMLIGQISGLYDQVSVIDFGINGQTGMDGLAVPRTSGFVAELMARFFDGGYSLSEKEAYDLLKALVDTEDISLEPAALAGLPGATRLFQSQAGQAYLKEHNLLDKMTQATHIAWATGGSMVPEDEKIAFYNYAKNY